MRLILPLLFLAASGVQAADMYKWTDEQGRVHYSDKPPPKGIEAESRAMPKHPEPPPAPPPVVESPECQVARKNWEILQNNAVVMIDSDGDGTAERVEGEGLIALKTRTEQQVKQYCDQATKPTP